MSRKRKPQRRLRRNCVQEVCRVGRGVSGEHGKTQGGVNSVKQHRCPVKWGVFIAKFSCVLRKKGRLTGTWDNEWETVVWRISKKRQKRGRKGRTLLSWSLAEKEVALKKDNEVSETYYFLRELDEIDLDILYPTGKLEKVGKKKKREKLKLWRRGR